MPNSDGLYRQEECHDARRHALSGLLAFGNAFGFCALGFGFSRLFRMSGFFDALLEYRHQIDHIGGPLLLGWRRSCLISMFDLFLDQVLESLR